jgi:WD40 repeat protein
LPGQLIGRLPANLSPDIDGLVKEASEFKGFPWLRPASLSLSPLDASLVRVLQGHTASIRTLVVTPDGRYVISGSDDNTLRIWELTTGASKKTLQGRTGGLTAVVVGHVLCCLDRMVSI